MTVTLKDAILATQTDLQVLADSGFKLTRLLGLVSGVLSSLPEGGIAPILLAKAACKAIINCAHYADDTGHTETAERFRCAVRMLSPVVARLSQGTQ